MTSIIKTTHEDISLLADIGKASFIESHGMSASPFEIECYTRKAYSHSAVKEELSDPLNIYHIIYYDGKAAGYSKIIFNSPHKNITLQNVTKLERIYLLKEFYGKKLGYELFDFNVNLSKNNGQSGMWLSVWTGNPRAVNFYKNIGFEVIGNDAYKLSDTHSNPNYQMYLKY